MSAEILKQVINMDSLQTKRRFMQSVQGMTGLWEISMKPRRLVRSLNQNAYYWAAVVTPFTEWLRGEWGDSNIQVEQAHELLKTKVLGTKELVNKKTGEVIEITRSSKTLDTHEFGEFIENAAAWLAEFTGIVVLSPDLFWESPPPTRTRKAVENRKSFTTEDEAETFQAPTPKAGSLSDFKDGLERKVS